MALRRCTRRILYWPCTTRHRSSSESASAMCSSTVLDTYPHSRRSRLHLTSHARACPLRSPIGSESRSSGTSCRSEINGDSPKRRLLGASGLFTARFDPDSSRGLLPARTRVPAVEVNRSDVSLLLETSHDE